MKKLNKDCNIPEKLSELGVDISMIDKLAISAMKVERLLKNNPRELKFFDAQIIYSKLF